MSKKVFIDFITLIHAFGVERDVIWSRESVDVFEEYLKENKGRVL